jgi:hypothetical protein
VRNSRAKRITDFQKTFCAIFARNCVLLRSKKARNARNRAAENKKKTMKTNKQNKTNSKNSSELKNRTEQLSENGTAQTPETAPDKAETVNQNAPVKPYVNFAERDYNRTLSVEKLLEKLKRWFPAQYELAEVVGKWVWITFPEQPAERVRADLSQLGFHWNNTRKCWQHPCGETLPRGTQEPREKYNVWFPGTIAALHQKQAQQVAA